MLKKSHTLVALSAIALIWPSFLHAAGNTASTTANAKVKVLTSLAILKTADLDFGTTFQSDVAKTIAPLATGAATFTVSGEPNTAYTVQIPAGSVNMVGPLATDIIVVNAFTSNPTTTAGAGLLSAGGTQTLSVGATRAAPSATQNPGSYSGSFTVQVIY